MKMIKTIKKFAALLIVTSLLGTACTVSAGGGSSDDDSVADILASYILLQALSNMNVTTTTNPGGTSSNCSTSFSTALSNARAVSLEVPVTVIGEEGGYCVFSYDNYSGYTTYPYAYATPEAYADVDISWSYYNDVPSSDIDYSGTVDIYGMGGAEASSTSRVYWDTEYGYYWVYIWSTTSSCGTSCSVTFELSEY